MFKRTAEQLYTKVLPYYSSEYHSRKGERNALSTFQVASTRVPAYRAFLREHNISPGGRPTMELFRQLPPVDKPGYLHRFGVEEMCLDGTLVDKYLIEGSSGYSGRRSYWPRMTSEDSIVPDRVAMLLDKYYGISTKHSLVIVGLMLGVWVSGEKVSWALRQVAMQRKYPLTIVTPGANAEEILDIIKSFSPSHEQTIIIAYPPFIKFLTDLGDSEGIDWKKYNIKLVTGGECFSEAWRDYMWSKLGHGSNEVSGILGIYGASEMSTMVGQESTFSIQVKRLANRDRALADTLFGSGQVLPTMCQYNPSRYYIETLENELHFTAMSAIPLVRYNIHDRGGVLSFDDVCGILRDHGYDPVQMSEEAGIPFRSLVRFPFLYVWGRSDGSALIYGAVIYPENIKSILDHLSLSEIATGNFRLVPFTDEDHRDSLQLHIELRTGIQTDQALHQKFSSMITSQLEEQNTDYQALRKVMGDKALLKIHLHLHRSGMFAESKDVKLHYL